MTQELTVSNNSFENSNRKLFLSNTTSTQGIRDLLIMCYINLHFTLLYFTLLPWPKQGGWPKRRILSQ